MDDVVDVEDLLADAPYVVNVVVVEASLARSAARLMPRNLYVKLVLEDLEAKTRSRHGPSLAGVWHEGFRFPMFSAEDELVASVRAAVPPARVVLGSTKLPCSAFSGLSEDSWYPLHSRRGQSVGQLRLSVQVLDRQAGARCILPPSWSLPAHRRTATLRMGPRHEPANAPQPRRCGWLHKKGGVRRNWRRRWFVLDEFTLQYFDSPQAVQEKGCIVLDGRRVTPSVAAACTPYGFQIDAALGSGGRTYFLAAGSKADMEGWISAVAGCCGPDHPQPFFEPDNLDLNAEAFAGREGPLYVESSRGRLQKRALRWCTVNREEGVLQFFRTRRLKTLKGSVRLDASLEIALDEHVPLHFHVAYPTNATMPRYTLTALSEAGAERWVAALRELNETLLWRRTVEDGLAVYRRLHVTVMNARGLPPPGELQLQLLDRRDPYCVVSVGDHVLRTATQWNSLEPAWFEEFAVDLYGAPDSIAVSVWDEDFARQDAFVGMAHVPVPAPGAAQQPRWCALRGGHYEAGELRLEISIVRERTPAPLRVTVHEARNLCASDLWGSVSPYVCLEIGSTAVQTQPVKNAANPVFCTEFVFFLDDEAQQSDLAVTVRHGRKGETIGSLRLRVDALPPYSNRSYALGGQQAVPQEQQQESREELGEVRVAVQYLEQLVLPLQAYTPLTELLLAADFELLRALGGVARSAHEPAASCTVPLLLAARGADGAVALLLEAELAAAEREGTLFRATTFGVVMMNELQRLAGGAYLEHTLGPVVDAIAAAVAARPAEVDPTRAGSEAAALANQAHLREYTELVANAVVLSAHHCPAPLRRVYGRVAAAARRRFPAAGPRVGAKAVAAFLILRGVSAALLQPQKHHLLPTRPSTDLARALTLVSKVLMNMANFVRFGAKEPYMEPFNEVLEQYEESMERFLEGVCSSGAAAARDGEGKGGGDGDGDDDVARALAEIVDEVVRENGGDDCWWGAKPTEEAHLEGLRAESRLQLELEGLPPGGVVLATRAVGGGDAGGARTSAPAAAPAAPLLQHTSSTPARGRHGRAIRNSLKQQQQQQHHHSDQAAEPPHVPHHQQLTTAALGGAAIASAAARHCASLHHILVVHFPALGESLSPELADRLRQALEFLNVWKQQELGRSASVMSQQSLD